MSLRKTRIFKNGENKTKINVFPYCRFSAEGKAPQLLEDE